MDPGFSDTAVVDVEAAAEGYAIAALRTLHCTIVRRISETNGPSPIEAWKANDHLLMHVVAAIAPDEPQQLTAKEAREFRRRARSANAEPWVAEVVLGTEMDLVRLDWKPLE